MMEAIKLNVEGITCGHCVRVVTASLLELNGVSNVKVDLVAKTICLDYNSDLVSLNEIKKAITKEGYDVI
jgi:copper chaperone